MNHRVLALKRETHFTNTVASDAQPVLRGISICRTACRRLPVVRPRRLCVRYSGVCLKPPAFQFYPDDFIGGTVGMSAEEVGHYIRLLCFQWSHGKLSSDELTLERIAGGKISDTVRAKFPRGKNRRLEQERRKQQEYRDKQRLKGIASAKARFNRGSTVVQPRVVDIRLEPEGNSPSPSPSPTSDQGAERAPLAPARGDGGVWRQRGRSSGLLQSPIAHAPCYPSDGCGRGLCVPRFVSAEWLGQCSGDAKYLDDFIASTLKFTPVGPQGDPAKWWRAQWDAKHRAPLERSNRPPMPTRDWRKECQSMHSGTCENEAAHQARLDDVIAGLRKFKAGREAVS